MRVCRPLMHFSDCLCSRNEFLRGKSGTLSWRRTTACRIEAARLFVLDKIRKPAHRSPNLVAKLLGQGTILDVVGKPKLYRLNDYLRRVRKAGCVGRWPIGYALFRQHRTILMNNLFGVP